MATAYGTGAIGAAGMLEAAQQINNKLNGNYETKDGKPFQIRGDDEMNLAKMDSSEYDLVGETTNKDGKRLGAEYKHKTTGETMSLDSHQDMLFNLKKGEWGVKGGMVSKVLKGAADGLGSAGDKIGATTRGLFSHEPADKPSDEPVDSTNNGDDNKTPDQEKQEVDHDKTSSEKTKEIVPKDGTNSKPSNAHEDVIKQMTDDFNRVNGLVDGIDNPPRNNLIRAIAGKPIVAAAVAFTAAHHDSFVKGGIGGVVDDYKALGGYMVDTYNNNDAQGIYQRILGGGDQAMDLSDRLSAQGRQFAAFGARVSGFADGIGSGLRDAVVQGGTAVQAAVLSLAERNMPNGRSYGEIYRQEMERHGDAAMNTDIGILSRYSNAVNGISGAAAMSLESPYAAHRTEQNIGTTEIDKAKRAEEQTSAINEQTDEIKASRSQNDSNRTSNRGADINAGKVGR
ncbi:hypothetical protein AGMMS50229_11160 [Campylobacterota bacterium]|nr:hypothetical protein AGMMS50229_11160 [Campylobacterota bacterium]